MHFAGNIYIKVSIYILYIYLTVNYYTISSPQLSAKLFKLCHLIHHHEYESTDHPQLTIPSHILHIIIRIILKKIIITKINFKSETKVFLKSVYFSFFLQKHISNCPQLKMPIINILHINVFFWMFF